MDEHDDALPEGMGDARRNSDTDQSEEDQIEIEDMQKEKKTIDENLTDAFRGVLNATQESLNEETKTSILIIKATYNRVLRTQSDELEEYFFNDLKARYQALFPHTKNINADNALRMLPRAAVIIHAYDDQPYIVDYLINDCEKCLLFLSKEVQSNCLLLLGRLLEWSIRIGKNRHILYPVERQRIVKNLVIFARSKEHEVRIACVKGLAAVQDEPVDSTVLESPKEVLTYMLRDSDWRVRSAVVTSITFVDTRFRDRVIYMAQHDEQAEIVVAAMNRLAKEDPFEFQGSQIYEALFGTLMDKNGNVRRYAQEQLAAQWISQIIKDSIQKGRRPTQSKLDGVAYGIFVILKEFSATVLTRQDRNCRVIVQRILEYYHQKVFNDRPINEFIRELLAGVAPSDIVITVWTFKKILWRPLQYCYPAIFFWRVLVDYVKKCSMGNDSVLLDALSRLSPTLKETSSETDKLFTSIFSQYLVRDDLEDNYDQCWIVIFNDLLTVLSVLDKEESGMESYRKFLLRVLTNMVITRNLIELAIREYIESYLLNCEAEEKQFMAAIWGDLVYHLQEAITNWYSINNIEPEYNGDVPILQAEPLAHTFMVLNAMVKTRRFEGIRPIVQRTLQRYDEQPRQMIIAGMTRSFTPVERDIVVIYIEMMAALSMQFADDYESYVPILCTIAYQIKDDAIIHQTLISAITDIILMSNYPKVLNLANSEENMARREDIPFDFIDYLNDALRGIPLDIEVGDYENIVYECAAKFVLHQPKVYGIHRLLSTMIARVMHPECFGRPYLRSMLMNFFEIFRGTLENQRLVVDAFLNIFRQLSGQTEEELSAEWTQMISEIVPEKLAAFITLSISAENLHFIVVNEKANKDDNATGNRRRSSLPEDPNQVFSTQIYLLDHVFDRIIKEVNYVAKNNLKSLRNLGETRCELLVAYASVCKCVNIKYGFTVKSLYRLKERADHLRTNLASLSPPPNVVQYLQAFSRSIEARLRSMMQNPESPQMEEQNEDEIPKTIKRRNERTPRNIRTAKKPARSAKSDRQKIHELMSVPSAKKVATKERRNVKEPNETPRRQQPHRAARRARYVDDATIPEEDSRNLEDDDA